MLTLIPARGGSKRCPRKNSRTLGCLPLVAWTIHAARGLGPIVSTDCRVIAALAEYHGAKVLMRPAELATDQATTESVALHALEHFRDEEVLLLQPTSPFRGRDLIERGLKIPGHVVAVKHDDGVVPGGPVHPTGAFYKLSAESIRHGIRFYSPGFTPIFHDGISTLDIDDEDDWERAVRIAEGREVLPALCDLESEAKLGRGVRALEVVV